jgi:hypothetical protein
MFVIHWIPFYRGGEREVERHAGAIYEDHRAFRSYHLRYAQNRLRLVRQWGANVVFPDGVRDADHNHVVIEVGRNGRLQHARWLYDEDPTEAYPTLASQPGTRSDALIRRLLQRWVNRRLCRDDYVHVRRRARFAQHQRQVVMSLIRRVRSGGRLSRPMRNAIRSVRSAMLM